MAWAIVLKPFMFVIEWMGVLVRNLVLAVRLFANMFAGHVVLATILIFIYVAGSLSPRACGGRSRSLSVLGQVALSLLELFVAVPAGVHLHVPDVAVHGDGAAPGALSRLTRRLRMYQACWAARVAPYWSTKFHETAETGWLWRLVLFLVSAAAGVRGRRCRTSTSCPARASPRGLGMGLTIIGAGIGFGKIGSSALDGMARQPEVAPRIQTAMIIIAAMLEGRHAGRRRAVVRRRQQGDVLSNRSSRPCGLRAFRVRYIMTRSWPTVLVLLLALVLVAATPAPAPAAEEDTPRRRSRTSSSRGST